MLTACRVTPADDLTTAFSVARKKLDSLCNNIFTFAGAMRDVLAFAFFFPTNPEPAKFAKSRENVEI